jgi:predicted MPP superfamily phosphohydrolase
VANLLQWTDALTRRYLKNLVWEPYLQQLTDTGVIILWATNAGTQPSVHITNGTEEVRVVSGSSRRVDALDMYLQRVELTGLQSDTRYRYRIFVDDRHLQLSQLLSFQTAPPPDSQAPFTFITFGDFGNGSASQKRLRNQMLRDSFDFILTTGDNSQGEGTYRQFDRTIFHVYRPILGKVPIFPTLGNHDYLTDDGAPYLAIFDLPNNAQSDSNRMRYYSFDYGNVHFAVVDSTPLVKAKDVTVGQEMLAWLRRDLSRATQPWKIVTCHHPPYNAGHYGSNERVQAELVPVFEAYGVDLVLSGHQHNYQRSKPLRRGQVTTTEAGGIVYIVSGAGAAARHRCSAPSWLAHSVSSVDFGLYNRIRVSGQTLIIEAVDERGEIRDTYTSNG